MSLGHSAPHSPHAITELRCRICHGTDDIAPDQYGMMLCVRHRQMSNAGLTREVQQARWWVIALWGAALICVFIGALLFIQSVLAATASYYSTQTATGVETSALVSNVPVLLSLVSACNYDTVNPKVAMMFDANAAPVNGGVPNIAPLPLAIALSASQPTCGSFTLPRDGVKMTVGAWVGCSTTSKTLTLDTVANCSFWVSR